AELGAITAVHADVDVNEEFLRLRLRPSVGLLAALDPDALRRTDLGANATGGTPVMPPALTRRRLIRHEKWHKAKPFWRRQFLFGIEHGLDALTQWTLTNLKGLLVIVTSALPSPFQIVNVGLNEMADDDPHTLDNA